MNNLTIKQLVAFAVLMEKGEGITTKSPTYVAEKWKLVALTPDHQLPTLMDIWNKAKYEEYLKTWKI